jgi:hypothetical protein
MVRVHRNVPGVVACGVDDHAPVGAEVPLLPT